MRGRLCMLIRDWIIENLANLSVLHSSWFEIQSRLSIYGFFFFLYFLPHYSKYIMLMELVTQFINGVILYFVRRFQWNYGEYIFVSKLSLYKILLSNVTFYMQYLLRRMHNMLFYFDGYRYRRNMWPHVLLPLTEHSGSFVVYNFKFLVEVSKIA